MSQEHADNPLNAPSDFFAFQVAFGKVIATHEANSGLSQRAFARYADISNTHLREIENGERNLKMQTIVKLAIALGTTPSKLIKETEDKLGWR